MYNIETKFDIGDQVYLIRKVKVINVCNVCEGKRRIEYKDKMMTCPECKGVGTLPSNMEVYVVKDEPLTVKSIRVSISTKCGSNTRRYKVEAMYESYVRAEENIYSTKELAQAACDDLNKIRTYINLNDIIINDEFKRTIPEPSKIAERINEYKTNKTFNTEIILNKENVLKDGYITYLVCKMLNIERIKVVIE
jgi:excinuclease UvrABC ATPase subunit